MTVSSEATVDSQATAGPPARSLASRLHLKHLIFGRQDQAFNGQAEKQEGRQDIDKALRKDFGYLPIPRRCHFDEKFKFTTSLNVMLAMTSTLTVANIYCTSSLIPLVLFADWRLS